MGGASFKVDEFAFTTTQSSNEYSYTFNGTPANMLVIYSFNIDSAGNGYFGNICTIPWKHVYEKAVNSSGYGDVQFNGTYYVGGKLSSYTVRINRNSGTLTILLANTASCYAQLLYT